VVRVLVGFVVVGAFCFGAALSYYNWDRVPFNYLIGQVELPLIALMLLSFLLGGVTVLLLNTLRIWALRLESRRLQKQLRNAEVELRNLRNLPLGGPAAVAEPAPPATPVLPKKNA
jgi:uncharacterized integral membrane protein